MSDDIKSTLELRSSQHPPLRDLTDGEIGEIAGRFINARMFAPSVLVEFARAVLAAAKEPK